MLENILKLKHLTADADAVMIAAGAGLSTAAGFVYSGERFERTFGDFGRKDGFHDMYSGSFYPYSTQEAFPACCPIVISGDSAQVIQEVLS